MIPIRLGGLFAAAVFLVACGGDKSTIDVGQQQAQPDQQQQAPNLEKDGQRNAYAMGASLARQMKNSGMELETESFLAGIRDVLDDAEVRISDEEIQTRVSGVQEQERFRRNEEHAAKNRAEAEAFLAANGEVEGVVTTASGLQYQVLVEGDGARPSATDMVTVNYRGTLLDGTEFDSSYARNEPASFPLNRVISGWTEALQLMSVGSKYKLFIPSDLAYGSRGAGELIGPDATLVFEVELLNVEAAAEDASG